MRRSFLIGGSLAATLALANFTPLGAEGRSDIFRQVEAGATPGDKLKAAQPLVGACDRLRKDELTEQRRLDPNTGFKADRLELNGTTAVAFGATEGIEQFARSALGEAKVLALAARAGGPKLAVLLFVFRAATGSLPEIPPDVATDFEYLVGGRPAQFLQAIEFAREARQFPGPVVLTGHSLGGALATYAAGVESMPAVTFNAPYLNAILRRDRPDGSRGQAIAFEAVRDSGDGVPRDAIASVTRLRFGSDPLVATVEVRVPARDPLLHGLDHFLMKSLVDAGLRWVPAGGAMKCTLPGGRALDLEAGSSVLDLGRGGEAVALAVRRGFLHASVVGDLRDLGRITIATVEADTANLRSDASTARPPIVGLPKGLTVAVLDRTPGQKVDGSTEWLRVEFMVLKKVSLLDSRRLTAGLAPAGPPWALGRLSGPAWKSGVAWASAMSDADVRWRESLAGECAPRSDVLESGRGGPGHMQSRKPASGELHMEDRR